ncbi:serine/threonine-protein kinase [Nocardia gamkensis]|uniref:serine/threonine-protein kinase n=1 Tax=Nocardia gamkensis TaxID=352869 RepID=UPI0007C7EC33|nr:serine/threonine-protein kinase [Nocardia gamkensis]NQE67433.1 putative L-type lectin-domain containing receptor kinase VI.1 [Nocardia gamkensis]
MEGQQVQLSTDWLVGERIGEGGFGHVYLAVGDGWEAVIKLVPKVPGAQRELLFANPDGVRNVIPILDSGEHGDYWVLVMPRAERSLRSRLAQESPLPLDEAVTVTSDVCDALVDLAGKVVHRDLKPDNILFYDGAWCLADFGISRYAEASTASDTRKYSKTPHYAAPEQWRNERATIATDMYALGIMAFEMIVGHRPFPGPSLEDLREQHLHGEVPDLPMAPAGLAALIDECLYKAPAARPAPANFRQRLDRYIAKANAAGGGLARLEEANKAEVRRRSAESRQQSEAISERERRNALITSATKSYTRISTGFRDAIATVTSAAALSASADGGWSVRFGEATLRFSGLNRNVDNAWGGWVHPVFDVLACASINLRIPPDQSDYEGRSHSLWFGDIHNAGQFGWFECAFMISPVVPMRGRQNPFALDPGEESAQAVGAGMAKYQVAWPFTRIEVDDLDELVGHWANWFAQAYAGALHTPSLMPEHPIDGSWRRQ